MKAIFLSALSAVVLAGCACIESATKGLVGAVPFDPEHPKIYIMSSADGAKKKAVVDQEPLVFFVGGKRDVDIEWEIVTSGYEFADGSPRTAGISFAPKAYGPNSQIRDCKPHPKDKRKFTCRNDVSGRDQYQYSIHVVPVGGGQVITSDPWVVND
jgi:hypothetical protein